MLLWKLFKTSFCAVCAITKCTSLQPTVSGIPARRGKNTLKIKTKSPKDGSKSGQKQKKCKKVKKKISHLKILTRSLTLKMRTIQRSFYLHG